MLEILVKKRINVSKKLIGFMCSSSFTFQSSEFSSSSISNRLARWCEIINELELSLYNRTGRQNDKSARGDETVH